MLWRQPQGSSQNLSLLPGLYSHALIPARQVQEPIFAAGAPPTDMWEGVCGTIDFSGIARNGKQHVYQWGGVKYMRGTLTLRDIV